MLLIRSLALLTAVASCAGLMGCTSSIVAYEDLFHIQPRYNVDLIRTTYNAVDALLARADPSAESPERILVATVVDLDNVENTSTFGRLSGELLAARLAQRGRGVVHATVRQGSVVIKDDGQFLLSRDMRELAEDYQAQAVLVSTYTRAAENVYVSIKLVNAADNALVAAVDYQLPIDPRTASLLVS
ncbi:MAG TPA: FlgO family outer membrane protein [Phycisphaerae bacterium]|nr:FlgO family outer membrane protein [Phycisphaerae bacterium]